MNNDLLHGFRRGPSKKQIRDFVVEKSGPTPWGKLCQAQRELEVRYDSLQSLESNLDAIDIRIAHLLSHRAWLLALVRPLGRRLRTHRIELAARERQSIVRSISDTEREAFEFEKIVGELKAEIGPVTEERRDALDEGMWKKRIERRIVLEYWANRSLSVATLEILASAPPGWSEAVMDAAWELYPTLIPPDFAVRAAALKEVELLGRSAVMLDVSCDAGQLPGPEPSEVEVELLER